MSHPGRTVRGCHEDEDGPPLFGVRVRDARGGWGAAPGATRGARWARQSTWRGRPRRPVGAGPRRGRRPGAHRRRRRRHRRARAHRGRRARPRARRAGSSPGSVTLLAGEPGMGKSTLLLQALGRMAAGGTTLPARHRRGVVRAGAAAGRARRRAAARPARRGRDVACRTCSPTSTPSRPQVLAVDSIQTVVDPDLPGAPGSVTQVRDGAYRLVQHAKEHGRCHGARRSRHQGGHARRARACSSTSSTPCSRSTATAATRCARSTR